MIFEFAPETIKHRPTERLRPYAQNAKTYDGPAHGDPMVMPAGELTG